ncbi:aldehyde dehydrogenase family protein [Croceicoccus hydrothermalis]|uniref:aldehyde dehydrogenase family protein n=1 Tax=Croceicoccus hydrothermalis TaxID=2867964 RepID=UPI001EFB6835|nr:aldehyde dehydrogenase family protein [Croceicoccus hydrothermalis]
MDDFKLYIGGKFVEGARSIDVINPATGQAFARCPVADEAQLDEAVAAARSAFPAWSALSQDDRAAMLMRIADAMQEQAGEFSRLLTNEQGKPLEQAGMEIMGAAFTLKAFAGMRTQPRILKDDGKARISEIRRPLGVVAAICPWNFPVMMLANKIGPALVTGNTVVLKPAPTTPLTALKFAEVCAGVLPAGVVNVICDDNDLGAALTAHPDVDKIAFTGSTATGRKVMEAAAASIKRVTLELGGNDAAIVLDDADPVATARKVFQGAMANAGQVCIAIKRAYVADAIYDAFCDELARLANAAVVDDGTKQGTQMGPVQNKAQFEKLKRLLDESRDEGTVIAGGAAIEREGYFIQPTVIRDVGDDARIVQEEQFGPVLPVLRYADIEDVLARSNDTRFGLGGSVWGGDVERAASIAERVESGTVWVNQHLALNPKVPFRGAKESGLGTELGEEGLNEYTQAKIINVAL